MKENSKLDKCVVCGVDTQYRVDEHIDFRMGYIEGCGQLCLDCWDKIYYKPLIDKLTETEKQKNGIEITV